MGRSQSQKKECLPDPKYKSVLVTRCIKSIMKHGKINIASRIFYGAMDRVEKQIEKNENIENSVSVFSFFEQALSNITPQVYMKNRRVGGSVHQVPTPIPPHKKTFLAIKWLIVYARKGKGKSMEDKLASEILSAYKGEGAAVKRKEEIHRMAESNRAYSHFVITN